MSRDAASKKALADAIAKGAYDPAFWLRFFLRSWFPSPFPPFMLGIIALHTKQVEWLNDYPDAHPFLLEHFRYAADPDDPTSIELPVFQYNSDGKIIMVTGDHLNLIIPRGFSKTTLANGLNLRESCVDGTLFLVYISKSAEHAETQLGNCKMEFETNQLLIAAYGDLVPNRSDPERWGADMIQLTNGAIFIARGRGGQVRGLNFRARRPNRILIDDVEDDEKARSPTVRKQTESWFYSAVEKAGQVMDGAVNEDWAQQPLQITNLGTLLGSQCLMMTLSKDPKFSTVKFGAKLHVDQPNDEQMLWAYKMSYTTYTSERARHQRIGKLAEFTRELDSGIRVGDDTIFPSIFMREGAFRSDFVAVSVFLDPAISEDPKADDAAMVVAGRKEDGNLWMLDEWGGKGKSPRDKIDAFFEMHFKWECTHHGLEAQSYQKALMFLMREEMARKQYFFHIQPVVRGSHEAKTARIVGMLSPRYLSGFIKHAKPLAGLEANILDWPNGGMDYADAAASALVLLGESQMLATPKAVLGTGEYAPLPQVLPPVYRSVTNHIVRSGRPVHLDPNSRYPRG
jgi:hypothetical protein